MPPPRPAVRLRELRRGVAIPVVLFLPLAAPQPGFSQIPGDRIARAVMPAPEPLRATATVLGYVEGGLVTLRDGEGPMICLADDPAIEGFHVACYHESLEPYMARGRELESRGLDGRESIARRWEEIEAGTLPFPDRAFLYSLSDRRTEDGGEASGDLVELTVVYLRGATAEELGAPTNPKDGIPWIMFPGKPTAHLMIHEPPPEREP